MKSDTQKPGARIRTISQLTDAQIRSIKAQGLIVVHRPVKLWDEASARHSSFVSAEG